MDIFDRMEALAREKGWSRSEFLRRVGLNPSAMRDWRVGKSSPDKHMNKIISALDTTEGYLRGETDDPRPDDQKELDSLEYALLDGAKKLNDDQKRAVIQMIRSMNK